MFCGLSTKYDFIQYCLSAGRSSARFPGNFLKLMILCDSWSWFMSQRIIANRLFAYLNGKIQIKDLLFSCASWIFSTGHREMGFKRKTKDSPSSRNKLNWMIVSDKEMNANQTYCVSVFHNFRNLVKN